MTPGFGGHIHYDKLREAAIKLGVRVLTHAPAKRLILDKHGSVLGVEVNALPPSLWAKHDAQYAVVSPWKPLNSGRSQKAIAACARLEASVDGRRRIRAQSGVILSTGGFIYNLDMLDKHRPILARSYEGLLRLGSMGCDGSGIKMGRAAGGAIDLMDRYFLGRPLAPPEAFLYGLMVNVEGQRFVNEDAYQSVFGDLLAEQPQDGRALLILDHAHFWKGIRQSFFPGKGLFMLWGAPALLNVFMGGTRRGKTLSALARKAKIDPAGLERTVADFNARALAGIPDTLGKSPDKIMPLEKGPFYAVNVSLNNKFGPTFAFTLGGLRVDDDSGEVKRADGSVIECLYAAGRTAVGLCSMGYMSGLSIADTVFSGRRAGRHASRGINRQGTHEPDSMT